ncbi:MAG TPA: cyclic nucleotide-binding domain-containing protein [Byssovorax sp.]|jgi:CRP-like cAMP-binding protein
MELNPLESVLASVSFLERLRPDEIGRAAKRFSTTTLAPGEARGFAPTREAARLVVVVRGRLDIEVLTAAGTHRSALVPGDYHGEIALLSEHFHETSITARSDATFAAIDRDGLDAILAETPAIALPLAEAMAREVAAQNDVVRQLLELHAERLPRAELADAIDERRRDIARRGARVTRLSPRALFNRLVVQRGREPPFWMLLGFLVALGGARLVVGLILKYGLEKRLFALVPGTDPNPMHVHHFNYGLVLVGAAGLAALAPFGRRGLRVLAFAFGVGAGLVFDEFGLIYNLNPEYAQRSSLIAAAIAATVLVQLTYFRRFWLALSQRAWLSLRSRR